MLEVMVWCNEFFFIFILFQKRIEQAGGTVELDNIGRYMVNGALNMSRSVGDLHLKQYGVLSLPDTRTFPVSCCNL